MKRLMPTVCLCMILVFSVAAPAFAQEEGRDAGRGRGGDVTVVDCSQVVNVFANQGQYANAFANGDGSTAAIAQYLDVSVDQANRCLGGVGPGSSPGDGPDDGPDGNSGGGNPDDPREGVIARTVVDGDLPDTGGPNLAAYALPLLALVVAGGISAARMVRNR